MSSTCIGLSQRRKENERMKRRTGAWWGLRWRILAGLLIGSLVVVHGSMARARTTTTVSRLPVDFVVENPCQGELVALSGQVHMLVHTTEDAKGGIHVHNQFNP